MGIPFRFRRLEKRSRAQIAELEAAVAAQIVAPKVIEEAAKDSDPPSSFPRPPAGQEAPEVVRVPPVLHANKAPLPKTRRRWDDPLIPSKGPVFGGGYGITGGRGA